jgi:hypothetical protein
VAQSNAFAFKNSGLGAFLYAEVGTELNGSVLTIQSVLARLGQDPWAEAGRWVSMPKATIIDRLAGCIAQMPLSPAKPPQGWSSCCPPTPTQPRARPKDWCRACRRCRPGCRWR